MVPIGAVLWGFADGEQISGIQVLALAGILVMVTIVQAGSVPKTLIQSAECPEA